MKKLIIFLIALLLPLSAFTADVWEEGAGNDVISGSDSPSDIDTLLDAASTEPLSRLLQDFREGVELEYSSTSELTAADGQVAVQNSEGTTVAFLDNSSSITITWADIDTGSEAGSTTYYIYAYCDDPTSDLDFDLAISTSSTSPTDITYYRRLGSFYNDSGSDIDYDSVRNDGFFTTKLGSWESKSENTVYQASTDGFVVAQAVYSATGIRLRTYTDSSNPPSTKRCDFKAGSSGTSGTRFTAIMPVKSGDYYEVVVDYGSDTIYWIPLEIN